MTLRGYFLAFVAFYLAVVAQPVPLSSNGPPSPAIPPTFSICDTRKTLTGGCCVFPFTYRGKQYNDCTTKDSTKEWCATTSDYDANNNQWGECEKAPKEVFDIILEANNKSTPAARALLAGSRVDLFQGDIAVDSGIRSLYLSSLNNGKSRTKRAAMRYTRKRWIINGKAVVPYVIERSNSHATGVIHRAMRHWESKVPCIRFKPYGRNGATGRYLSFFSGAGCYSYVGRASTSGRQRISIGPRCDTLGVVVHEIGHALGFWHEQSRPDRDRYVSIIWRNIPPRVRGNFNKYGTHMINSRGVSYDYNSIMHYSSRAFSMNGQPTIVAKGGRRRLGQRYGLSPKDIQQANLLYCGSGPRPRTPPPPRPPTPPPPGCQYTDNSEWCSVWKKQNYCTSGQYRRYMSQNCKKSCLCRQTVSRCKDNDSRCSTWRHYCNDKRYAPYVTSKCRKTCKVCS